MAVLAWVLPLPYDRRIRSWAIGAAGSAACVLAALSGNVLPNQASIALRDWLPVPLLLVAYHQAGQLFTKPWHRFQSMLWRLDQRMLGRLAAGPGKVKWNPFLSGYFEVAYAVCYPLIPAALGALYLLHLGAHAGEFWTVVLPPTYLCYALVPILPALPPRLLHAEPNLPVRGCGARNLNLWVLRHWSIQANTFPSAHVAACVAASLVLLRWNLPAGICFLWIALSIAAAVVVLRYHYLLDSLLGIILSLVLFLLLTG